MGRTRLERAVALLRKEVTRHKLLKKRILNYVEAIKNKCLKKEISYDEYESIIHQKLEGKTIQQWLDYYDFHIQRIEKKIQSEIRKHHLKKSSIVIIIAISLILLSLLYFIPSFHNFFTDKIIDYSNILSNFSKNIYKVITGFTVDEVPSNQPLDGST